MWHGVAKGMTKHMTLKQILILSRYPGWISYVPEAFQTEAEAIHDWWLGVVSEAARERHKEVRLVREKIAEWKASPEMAAFARDARMRYLKQQIKISGKLFQQSRLRYIEAVQKGESKEVLDGMVYEAEGLSKRLRGYEISLEVLEGKRSDKTLITDEMIERAREYPIESLLEIGHNKRAKCVFHQGEGWNMDIRKNFAHCYVCGATGDTINVYRAQHGCGFREAVLALQ